MPELKCTICGKPLKGQRTVYCGDKCSRKGQLLKIDERRKKARELQRAKSEEARTREYLDLADVLMVKFNQGETRLDLAEYLMERTFLNRSKK